MSGLSKQEKEAFLDILDRIEDARLRYFFLMMGSAIADHCQGHRHDGGQAPPPRTQAAN